MRRVVRSRWCARCVDCRKYKDVTRNGGFVKIPRRTDLSLERICSNLLSLSVDVKHWKSDGCNESSNEINVQSITYGAQKCALRLTGFLHFAINEWSFVVKQMFVVNNIASIYSRINITRAIETRIVRSRRSGSRSDWTIDWSRKRERALGKETGRGSNNAVERMGARECVRV